MSTAHRPTYQPARGAPNRFKTAQVSAKNLPAYLVLKERKRGQNSRQEVSERDFRAELEAKERLLKAKRQESSDTGAEETTLLITGGETNTAQATPAPTYTPQSDEEESNPAPTSPGSESDEDVEFSDSDDEALADSDSDDEDDEDEEELIRKQLEEIKQEREAQRLREQAEMMARQQASREQEILKGNPLLRSEFVVKRRWDDDVVFKNQAKEERKAQKRFINDTIRNDFHKKFLDKYVK